MASIQEGQTVYVLRGAHKGKSGVVRRAHDEQPHFWWVALYQKNGELGMSIVLAEGQLQSVKGGGHAS